MESILNKIKAILSTFKQLLFFGVIFGLLVLIQFKNNSINRLKTELEKKPQVEFIYQHHIDTVKGDSIPYPIEVVKYKNKIIVNTDTIPIELTKADSAQIAEAYIDLYGKYNDIKIYEDILKDDSLAFIQLNEKVTQNSIFDRELIYQDRTPVIQITNTIVKQDKTFSVIGGLDASIGSDFNTISLGAGIVTHSNRVFIGKYDPANKGYGVEVYLPIFNFRK